MFSTWCADPTQKSNKHVFGAGLNILLACAQIRPKNVWCLSVGVETLVFTKVMVYLGNSQLAY